jgi:hypothetical protein
MSEKTAAVFLCNKEYYLKFRYTCYLLVTRGQYKGDIVLVIGDDLYDKDLNQLISDDDEFITRYKVIIKYFPNYEFTDDFLQQQKQLNRDAYWFEKRFQFHKFNLFDVYFKQWDYIFYIDCGVHIFSDVSPILNEKQQHTILANRDGLDGETAAWCVPETPGQGLKLGDQFTKTDPIYDRLSKQYNMKLPYFQSTVMLYHTEIITERTVSDLYDLLFTYPICITNDQAIIGLYFTQVKPSWVQLRRKNDETYFYDYVRCINEDYIMLKSLSGNFVNVGYG